MLAAALLFSSGFSYSVLAEEGTEPTTKLTTEPTTEPITEPTTEPITEPTTELITEPTTEPSTEPVTEPTTEPDTAVTDVQNLINALPTAETLAAMSAEEQQAAREKLDSVQQAYMALSDEQKGQVTGAEIFDRLYEFFNKAKNEAPTADTTLKQETLTTEEETEKVTCTCETACPADAVNTDCPMCSADSAQCTGTMPEANTVLLGNEPDTTVTDVQDLIDALPTAEELKAMPSEEQQAVYTQLCEAYDAYEALSDEQKSQVTGAEIFDALFAVFNGMTEPLEDRIITGGTYSNSDFADMQSGETLKITGGETVFTDDIWLPEGVKLEITGGVVRTSGVISAHSVALDGDAVVLCNYLGFSVLDGTFMNKGILIQEYFNAGQVYGNVSLLVDLTIPTGYKFYIMGSLTIPENVTLTNNGEIVEGGTLSVQGDVDGTGSVDNTVTVNKKSQTATAIPLENMSRTDSSITIPTVSGQKYAITEENTAPGMDASEWQDGIGGDLTFNDLQSGTKYYLWTYLPGNAYYADSAAISAEVTTIPVAGDVLINYKAETISFADTLEVNTSENFDGTSIANNGSITDYIKDTDQTIYVRVKATVDTAASEATPVTIPARPAAPVASLSIISGVPNKLFVLYTGNESIEARIKTDAGDYGLWQSERTFLNLRTSDTYTVQIRKAATTDSFASVPVTKENCRTAPAMYEITIPKTADVGGNAASIEIADGNMPFDLGTGGQVDVKVKSGLNSDGTLALTRENDPSTTIASQMKVGGDKFTDLTKSVAVFKKFSDEAVPISFDVPNLPTGGTTIPAGTYKGTVTFEISYSEP